MQKLKSVNFTHIFATKRQRLIASGIAVFMIISSPFVYADTLQQQINNLNNQNAQTQQSVKGLQIQAGSYQDAIGKLQQQISAIQGAIAASQAKQAQLQQQIIDAQNNIVKQKKLLGNEVRTLYVDGQMTTIEELATSKNLSDYVDKQTYNTSVQNKINGLITQIAALEQQLQQQKLEIDQLVKVQQQQQVQLDSDYQQQASLLAYNQSQQDQYNSQIAANKGKISALQAEQARINAANSRQINISASGGSGGSCDNGHGNGGYPMAWCNAPQDSIPTIPYSSDPINRECTSFAYWYFTNQEAGHGDFTVKGNAKDWVYTSNYAVDQTPQAGAIAVSTAGPYGHVLIVLAAPGGSYGGYTAPPGYVITMSMNYDYYGHFIVDERVASSLYYIHP